MILIFTERRRQSHHHNSENLTPLGRAPKHVERKQCKYGIDDRLRNSFNISLCILRKLSLITRPILANSPHAVEGIFAAEFPLLVIRPLERRTRVGPARRSSAAIFHHFSLGIASSSLHQFPQFAGTLQIDNIQYMGKATTTTRLAVA